MDTRLSQGERREREKGYSRDRENSWRIGVESNKEKKTEVHVYLSIHRCTEAKGVKVGGRECI